MEYQPTPADEYFPEEAARLRELQQEHGKHAAGRLLIQEAVEKARADIEANPFQFEE